MTPDVHPASGLGGLDIRSVVGALPTAAYACDRDGRILHYNEGAVALWGRTPGLDGPADRYCGAHARFDADGAAVPPDECEVARVLAAGQAQAGPEACFERPDGTRRIVRAHASPLHGPDGTLVGAMCVLVDVTDRKRTEDQLGRVQAMAALGQLARGMAHDFNNLLTVINGQASLLLDQATDVEPEREMLEEILTAGERARALTRRLLALSPSDGPDPEAMMPNRALADLEPTLRGIAGDDVAVVLSLDPRAGSVRIRSTDFEQILVNLTTNARQAMPDGGTLTLETREVWLDEAAADRLDLRQGTYVRTTVTDNGSGIPEDECRRVFEPFFTTRSACAASGLGLAVVQSILHHAGGTAEMASRPGAGTSVRIFLPAVDPPDRTPDEPTGGPPTVLLVEDEAAVRNFATKVLTREGYAVLEAADGEAALALLTERPASISVVVSDMVMPRLGGKELLQRIRRTMPDLPAILMSGYPERDFDDRGQGIEYLAKPFRPAELASMVRTAVERRARAG